MMTPEKDFDSTPIEGPETPNPNSDEFALTSAQIALHRLQVAQYRKMLAQNVGRSRLRTLIVEDQAFSRNLLHQVLNQSCAVSTSSNAKDGWKIFLEEMPDIAFLDIEMPGINGHVLAEKMKELDPETYIVMVTANKDAENVQAAKANHVDGFVVKPFSKQKIDESIQRYLAIRKVPSKTGIAAR